MVGERGTSRPACPARRTTWAGRSSRPRPCCGCAGRCARAKQPLAQGPGSARGPRGAGRWEPSSWTPTLIGGRARQAPGPSGAWILRPSLSSASRVSARSSPTATTCSSGGATSRRRAGGGCPGAGSSRARRTAGPGARSARGNRLEVVLGQLAGAVDRPAPGGRVLVIRDYAATVAGGALTAGDDADDARWFSMRELDRLPLSTGLLEALNEWGVAGLVPSHALVAEATRRAGIVWLTVPGAGRAYPAWHLWRDPPGAAYLVTGPGEQPLRGWPGPPGWRSPCRARNPAARWSRGRPGYPGWSRARRSGTRSPGRWRPPGSMRNSIRERINRQAAGPPQVPFTDWRRGLPPIDPLRASRDNCPIHPVIAGPAAAGRPAACGGACLIPVVSPPTAEQVTAALARVDDLEIRRPITELGMVKSVDVGRHGKVRVEVYLTVAGSRSARPSPRTSPRPWPPSPACPRWTCTWT